MNLTCVAGPSGQTAGTAEVITIVLNWPGGTMPAPPPNSTTLVAPNPDVEYQVSGFHPDGRPIQHPMEINGANVAVYSSRP